MAFSRFSICSPCCQNTCPSGTTFLTVGVEDSCNHNQGLPGATVTIDLNGGLYDMGVTNISGVFTTPIDQPGTYFIEVMEQGYTSGSGTVVIPGVGGCGHFYDINFVLSPTAYDGVTFILSYQCCGAIADTFQCNVVQGMINVPMNVTIADNSHIQWDFPGRIFVPDVPIIFIVTNSNGMVRQPISVTITPNTFDNNICGGVGASYFLQDFPTCIEDPDGDYNAGYRCSPFDCEIPWLFPHTLTATDTLHGVTVLGYAGCVRDVNGDGLPSWSGDNDFNFQACILTCQGRPPLFMPSSCTITGFAHIGRIHYYYGPSRIPGVPGYGLSVFADACASKGCRYVDAGFDNLCGITTVGIFGQTVHFHSSTADENGQTDFDVPAVDTSICNFYFQDSRLFSCPPGFVDSYAYHEDNQCGLFWQNAHVVVTR